jgi:hypothetical protein
MRFHFYRRTCCIKSCVENGFSRQVTFKFREDYYLWVLWRPYSHDACILNEALMKASRQSHEITKAFAQIPT